MDNKAQTNKGAENDESAKRLVEKERMEQMRAKVMQGPRGGKEFEEIDAIKVEGGKVVRELKAEDLELLKNRVNDKIRNIGEDIKRQEERIKELEKERALMNERLTQVQGLLDASKKTTPVQKK